MPRDPYICIELEYDDSQSLAEAVAEVADHADQLTKVGRCYTRPYLVAYTLTGFAAGMWASNLACWWL